ncbi:MAG: hypothetical protein WC319_08160 [Candidatus Paceibacterota bacterium]|jgi:hypothetical protein
MKLIIDGISKREALQILNRQYDSLEWKIVDGIRIAFPTEKVIVKFFNTQEADGDNQCLNRVINPGTKG